MLKAIIDLVVLYLLYKLIFDFIVPIYQTTKQVKQKVNEIQRNMNEQQNQQRSNFTENTTASSGNKVSKDDYIDYEEIK